ncbi:hypothetical protein P7K49_024307, partial [Saguinus oedipus]
TAAPPLGCGGADNPSNPVVCIRASASEGFLGFFLSWDQSPHPATIPEPGGQRHLLTEEEDASEESTPQPCTHSQLTQSPHRACLQQMQAHVPLCPVTSPHGDLKSARRGVAIPGAPLTGLAWRRGSSSRREQAKTQALNLQNGMGR